MQTLLSITWNVNPELFSLGFITPRWYGLFFAAGFLLGYLITQKVFRSEKADEKMLDSLLLYLILGTIIGARLGHVLFYNPGYYLENPLEILKIWTGGLASHGGSIGVLLAMYIWSRKVSKKPFFWVTDRIAMSVGLTGFFIRMGNLMNSEIIGIQSDLPWAFEFVLRTDKPGPRHPAQLYEALAYLAIFALLFYMFWKTKAKSKPGFLTGLFITLVFIARFFIEFVKERQAEFDAAWLDQISMGQLLSIPFILLGIYFMYRGTKSGKKEG